MNLTIAVRPQVIPDVVNITVNSTAYKAAFVTAKDTISNFYKREVDGFYPKRQGPTSFILGSTGIDPRR